MHYAIEGEGRPVLLLHGGGVSGWMWKPLLRALGSGFRAIVPDLPGHGRSGSTPYRSHADAVAALADLLRSAAPDGAIVVGFSLGSQLAMELARAHPALVDGVVLVSGEAKPAPAPGFTLRLLSWTLPLARQRWFARLQAKQLRIPTVLLGDFIRESAAIDPRTVLASVSENIRYTLPTGWLDIDTPLAILVGARERRLMLDSAELLRQSHGAAELEIVPGSGHDIPFTQPDLLARVIRRVALRGRR